MGHDYCRLTEKQMTMSKQLFIIRHAKSDWSFEVEDIDRPLNARGFENAPEMARRLIMRGETPQLLVSSPAKRALTTAQIFAEHLHTAVRDIRIDPRIYEAQPDVLLNIINEIDDRYDRAALFGHNPGLTSLANLLADENIGNIPTCGIVQLIFEDLDGWNLISGGLGKMVFFDTPKR